MATRTEGSLFGGPACVILLGSTRSLLNWVAYAMATATSPEYRWVDVRSQGEVLADSDPLKRNVIPSGQLTLARAADLAPDHSKANLAVAAVVRHDEPPEDIQLLVEFLRLPERSQVTLSREASAGRTMVTVLSNAHRLGAHYPVSAVDPALRAIRSFGGVVIMTFADAPNDGRWAFDFVVHIDGDATPRWRQATVRVEKGLPEGPLRTGRECPLGEFEPIARTLAQHLG